jgi:hypothetical protein
MTNWQHAIYQSVASLATGKGSDFGYVYVERENTTTYLFKATGLLKK